MTDINMANGVDKELALEKQTWQQVRTQLQPLNPEFVEIIDELDPGPEYYFYKATYPYGSDILQRGAFNLPCRDGSLIPFVDDTVPSDIRDDLDYNLNTNPVTIPLEKSLELFVTIDQRLIPYSVIKPGQILGFSRILDLGVKKKSSHAAMSIWDMTAGARSIFMLPKISDTASHNRLKKAFRLFQEKPFTMFDHWEVFRELATNADTENRWQATMLFMSKNWLRHLDDKAWLRLRCFLLTENRRAHEFWHNSFSWNLAFSHIQQMKQIKASPHIMDTVRHLFTIGTGTAPGFEPANNDELAPIRFLQKVYVEEYGLKDYAPILVQPAIFSFEQKTPIYYSLNFPTSMEFSQKASDGTSTISDLYEVYSVMQEYQAALAGNHFNLQGTPLQKVATNTEYRYYHTNTSGYPSLEETSCIPDHDAELQSLMASSPQGNQDFPKNSSFLRGSIQLNNTSIQE